MARTPFIRDDKAVSGVLDTKAQDIDKLDSMQKRTALALQEKAAAGERLSGSEAREIMKLRRAVQRGQSVEISGYASTASLDRHGDVIVSNAFTDNIRLRGLSGPRGVRLFLQHRAEQPLPDINFQVHVVGDSLLIINFWATLQPFNTHEA